MSRTPEELLKLASDFDNVATRALVVTAKKKEKKKLDPKAKVRNRGTACVPAESAKDKKDHFPINDEAQARNALARVHQYSAAPPWYSGSLKGLQDLVSRKVHSKYPGIGKADKKSKKSSFEFLISKYGQMAPPMPPSPFRPSTPAQPPTESFEEETNSEEDHKRDVESDLREAIKALQDEAPSDPEIAAILKQLEDKLQHGQKKASEYYDDFLNKYGQGAVKDPAYAKNLTDSRIQSINAINTQTLTPEQIKEQAGGYLQSAFNDFQGNLISQEQYSQIVQAGQNKMFGTDTRQGPVPINWNMKPQQPAQTTPTPTATPAKPRSKFPTIDPVFQTMLGVNPDGSLGPQTQAALEMYKKSIGLPYGADEATRRTDSNKNNQQAFESLKQRPEYKTKSKMVYDDTSDVYKAPAGGIVRQNPF